MNLIFYSEEGFLKKWQPEEQGWRSVFSDGGLEYGFQGTINAQKSPKNRFFLAPPLQRSTWLISGLCATLASFSTPLVFMHGMEKAQK